MTKPTEKKTKTQPADISIPDKEYFDTYDEDAEFVRDFGNPFDDFRNDGSF